MAAPQTFQNYSRFDTKFHFTLIPLLLLNVIASIVWTVRHHAQHPHLGYWIIAMSCVLVWMALLTRQYALRNQDRLIRLEERLRLAALLPTADSGFIQQLTTRQLIALRFAPDAELPTLARRALAENLSSKQIKESIQSWRPDNERI